MKSYIIIILSIAVAMGLLYRSVTLKKEPDIFDEMERLAKAGGGIYKTNLWIDLPEFKFSKQAEDAIREIVREELNPKIHYEAKATRTIRGLKHNFVQWKDKDSEWTAWMTVDGGFTNFSDVFVETKKK